MLLHNCMPVMSMLFQSVQAAWSVFIVGQTINFGLVPIPLRICFAMVLTFIFNILLALVDAMAEAAEAAAEQETEGFKKTIANSTTWE